MERKLIQLSDVITDIAAGPFGSNLKVSCFVNDGFPIIDGANLKGFKVTDNITKFVTEEKARSLHRSIAKRGDVVVTISGTLGQIAYISDDSNYEEYLCSQRQFRVTFDTTKVYVPYLVFYFHTYEGKHKILSFANQVGVPALSQPLKNFRQISVQLPTLETQKKIASIVETINGKIEQNEIINNNLEQQAQVIFKSWFVDFEPYDGVMPSNWHISQLGSIARISTEVFSPSKSPNVEVEHYSIPAYDEKHYPVFENSDGIKSNKYRLTSNSVMISKLNPDTKRIWRPYCVSNRPICSTEFIVYEPINPLNRDFVYSIVDSVGFSAYLCSHTTGSTNSRQRATPSITLNYNIVLPDDKTLRSFCSIVTPMYDAIENNIKENQKLAITRDILLPKLMSGELDVSDIDL